MPAFHIVVVNKLAERHLAAINQAAPGSTITVTDADQLGRHIGSADILVTWGHIDLQPQFAAAGKLRWIHALSAGVEKLVFEETNASSVALTNSRGIHGIPMAEHVLSLMLTFTRGLHILFDQQRQKIWRRTQADELYEKTIGIVGLGSIGREIAKRAKALGMKVVATKREPTTELFVDALYPPAELSKLLQTADFVVVTLPMTPQTTALFTAERFCEMKQSAYFINVARGGVVNQADLTAALEQGVIKGAALDVFESEPLPEHSPLWTMPNVLITPHIAALSPQYLDRAVKLFCENLTKFSRQEQLINIIDQQRGY